MVAPCRAGDGHRQGRWCLFPRDAWEELVISDNADFCFVEQRRTSGHVFYRQKRDAEVGSRGTD
jgi:hypothetical protein